MRAAVSTPYADTRAADLSWSVEHPDLAALATLELTEPGTGRLLQLRILGASHQVLLRDGTGLDACRETVACVPGRPSGLPDTTRRELDSAAYTFSARVERLTGTAFVDYVDGLRTRLADDPRALVAEFPGSPYAVTALRARLDADRAAWTTWHAYPQAGEIVVTDTEVVSAQ